MSEYTPDRWLAVEITLDDGASLFKILGSWYGGYLDGDSWRISSGATDVKEEEDYYDVTNVSGSVYRCYKRSEGASAYTLSLLDMWIRETKGQIQAVKMEDIQKGVSK